MTTLEQVTLAANTRLATISGLNEYSDTPDNVIYPAVWMDIVPDIDFRDSAEDDQLYTFEIVLLVSAAMAEHRRKLIPYLERTGPSSIFAAFESNRALGFTDVDCYIRSARSLGYEEVAGYGAYGAAFAGSISIAGA